MKEKLLLFLAQNLVKGRGFVFTNVLGHCLHTATENGADVIVAGSYVFKAADRSVPINRLKSAEK